MFTLYQTICRLQFIETVTAIIGAFSSSVKLYQEWREKKQERKEKIWNQDLDHLVVGDQEVRREYDAGYSRLGQRFAIGDGTFLLALPPLYSF